MDSVHISRHILSWIKEIIITRDVERDLLQRTTNVLRTVVIVLTVPSREWQGIAGPLVGLAVGLLQDFLQTSQARNRAIRLCI